MSRPWYSAKVDYDFFAFKGFRNKYWGPFKYIALFFFILPVFSKFYVDNQRLAAQKALGEKKN